MLLFLAVVLFAFWGHTPLGWIGGFLCLGAWVGLKVAK